MKLDEDSSADSFFEDLLHAVDQQLESKDTPFVKKTYDRLVGEGLEEEQAKELIAQCLAEESDRMFRSQKPFDMESYRTSLEMIKPEG